MKTKQTVSINEALLSTFFFTLARPNCCTFETDVINLHICFFLLAQNAYRKVEEGYTAIIASLMEQAYDHTGTLQWNLVRKILNQRLNHQFR